MTPSSSAHRHPAVTLIVLAIGALAFSLAQTAIVPVLATMQHAFGVGTNDITWVVTADFLAASVATPLFGRLGDMYGKQRLLTTSLAVFAVGSAVSAVGDSLAVVLAGRVLQGLGGGVFPLSFGIIRDEIPLPRVPSAIASLGATAGVGGAIGLPLGGLLADHAGYRWIFWIAAAIALVAALGSARLIPRSRIRTPGDIDLVGAGLLAAGLSAVLIALSQATAWGWADTRTVGLGALGAVLLGVFARVERRHDAPLVNMRTLARPTVLVTNVATLLVGFGLYGTFILIPQMAELPAGGDVGLGLGPTEAGLLIAPGGLMILIAAPLAGRIGERCGSKLPLAIGCAIAAAGLAAMAVAHDSPGLIALWSAVFNTGVGCAFAAVPNLVIAAAGVHETGEATGVNTVARNIGASLGGQVAASILAAHGLAGGAPTERGFQLAFLSGASVTLVAGLCGLLIPTPKPARCTALPAALAAARG